MTTAWRILALGDRDPVAPVDDVVGLVDRAGTSTGAAYGRSDVVEALYEHEPAVVAVTPAGDLVGAVVARVSGSDAHVVAFAIHPDWRRQGIGSALLRQLDQSFVRQIDDRGEEPMVKAIVNLAHEIGLSVVAEGIETAQQLAYLRELGCDLGQGYLLCHPLPGEELATFCRDRVVVEPARGL